MTTKKNEYELRVQNRANENAALAKAIAVLNNDDAFGAFKKVRGDMPEVTITLNFAQRAAVRHHAHIQEQNHPFQRVFDQFEKLLKDMAKEGEEDVTKRDLCVKERASKKDALDDLKLQLEGLEGKISQKETDIEKTTGQLAANEKDLTKNMDDQKETNEKRQQENAAYKKTVSELVQATQIIGKAVDALKVFYESEAVKKAALVQKNIATPKAPDATFAGNKDGGFVIRTLQEISQGLKDQETDDHKNEETAQKEFEEVIGALKKTEEDLKKAIAENKGELAKAKTDLSNLQAELMATTKEIAAVNAHLANIKPGCDFIQNNFDEREQLRKTEMTSIETAMDLLKKSPTWVNHVADMHQQSLGDCQKLCNDVGEAHAECQACLAKISVAGYCTQNKGTEGC